MTEAEVDGARTSITTSPLDPLYRAAGAILQTTAEQHRPRLGKVVQLDVDVAAWCDRLGSRPETPQLESARRELGFAAYAAASGMYMHAFGGLRLFLELSFASVYFSVNELHRRRWMNDRQDFSWSTALDENEGVLSRKFVMEFSQACVEESSEFALMAAAQYRHCSQFMHGKYKAASSLPVSLSYSAEAFEDWCDTAVKSARSVLFLLYMRYAGDLDPGSDVSLSATLESSFSNLISVRTALGLPIEGGQ